MHCYLSGKLGGVQQITSRVACDEVDLVLFFRDPLKVDASSLNEQNLLRLCDMHGVPIATNIATAEVLLRGLDQGDLDYREGMHPPVVEPVPVLEHRAVCWSTVPCAETDFVYRGKQRRRNVLRRCCFVYSCLPSGRNT